MLVKELIKELQKYDGTLNLCLVNDGNKFKVSHITQNCGFIYLHSEQQPIPPSDFSIREYMNNGKVKCKSLSQAPKQLLALGSIINVVLHGEVLLEAINAYHKNSTDIVAKLMREKNYHSAQVILDAARELNNLHLQLRTGRLYDIMDVGPVNDE